MNARAKVVHVGLAVALLGVCTANSVAQSSRPDIYRTLPVEIRTRETPTAVWLTDGKYHIAYTLFVTNWVDRDLRFHSLEIAAAEDTVPVATYDSAALANPLRQRSTFYARTSQASAENLRLGTGRTSIISVDFTLASPEQLPQMLRHTVRFARDSQLAMRRDDGSVSPDLVVRSAPLRAQRQVTLVIDAPVRGGPWRCGNGLSFDNAHAFAYPFREAVLKVPQRFGCDFFKTDSAGQQLPNPFPNDITNEMFYGYREPVIAVADGIIAHVTDSVPENVPQANGSIRPPVPFTNVTASGNWVSLRIADSVYAFYAHLVPGSIRVRVGQKVKRGQVLGLLGNSGNSVGPHLHFHVGNVNSLNGSDAVPHVYRRFDFLGVGAPRGNGEPRVRQLPGQSAILRFQ